MPSCLLLRNIAFGRFWAGVICLSLLSMCWAVCEMCAQGYLYCMWKLHGTVLHRELMLLGLTWCGGSIAGCWSAMWGFWLWRPSGAACVLPAILEQPGDTAYGSWVCAVIPWKQQDRWLTSVDCQAPCGALFLSPESLVIYTSLLIIIPMCWDHSGAC